MLSLEETFEARLDSAENKAMLGNLALIVAAHDAHPTVETPGKFFQRDDLRYFSGFHGDYYGGRVDIRRRPELLASYHGLTISQLTDFASGGVVVDVGAGESRFLDSFRDAIETVALDINKNNRDFQRRRGHTVYDDEAQNMTSLATASIRLLHASYSAPFWSRSIQEAAQTAWEYLRVLEPGGIALVGPVARYNEHRHYEYVAQTIQCGSQPVIPWDTPEDAHASHIWTSFSRTVLGSQIEGDLFSGFVDIVASRYIIDSGKWDFAKNTPDLQVPNYLILRRTSQL